MNEPGTRANAGWLARASARTKIPPGPLAILAFTVTGAVSSAIAFHLLEPVSAVGSTRASRLAFLGAMLAALTLPVAWKGLGPYAATLGIHSVVLLLAGAMTTRPSDTQTVLLLLEVPFSLVFFAIGFGGQPGRRRIFYPWTFGLLGVVAGGIGISAVASRLNLQLGDHKDWVWIACFSFLWASVAIGDFVATTSWVQGALAGAIPGPGATIHQGGTAGRGASSMLSALRRILRDGWAAIRRPGGAAMAATAVLAAVSGLLIEFIVRIPDKASSGSPLADKFIAMGIFCIAGCLPLLPRGPGAWLAGTGLLAAFGGGLLVVTRSDLLNIELNATFREITLIAAALGTALVAFRRGRSWKEAFLCLGALVAGGAAAWGGAAAMDSFHIKVGDQAQAAATFGLVWTPVAIADWLGARWLVAPSAPTPPSPVRVAVLAPPGRLLPVAAIRLLAVLSAALGLAGPLLVLRLRTPSEPVSPPAHGTPLRPSMYAEPGIDAASWKGTGLSRSGWHLRSGRPILMKDVYAVTGRNPTETSAKPDARAGIEDAEEYCDALSLYEGFTPCYVVSAQPKWCDGYLFDGYWEGGEPLPGETMSFYIERYANDLGSPLEKP